MYCIYKVYNYQLIVEIWETEMDQTGCKQANNMNHFKVKTQNVHAGNIRGNSSQNREAVRHGKRKGNRRS